MPCFSLILVCKVSVTPARFFKKGRKPPLVFRDSLTYMSMKSVLNVYVFLFSIASFNCLTRFFRSNIVIPFFYLFCPHVGYHWNIILSFRILVRLSLIQTRPKPPLSFPLTVESSGRFLFYISAIYCASIGTKVLPPVFFFRSASAASFAAASASATNWSWEFTFFLPLRSSFS